MASKITYLLILIFTSAIHTHAQRIYKNKIVSNGFENNKLVRNHTMVYYFQQNSKLVEGIVVVDRVSEYASDKFNLFTTHITKDTLLTFHGIIDKGKKHGTFLDFPQDNKFYVYTYRNDVEDGLFQGFFYSGQLYCKGYYQNGKQTGIYKQYYANGKPSIYKEMISEPDNIAYTEFFYQNGQLESKGSYYNGKKVNEWFYYNNQGILLRKEYYNNKGKLLKTK